MHLRRALSVTGGSEAVAYSGEADARRKLPL